MNIHESNLNQISHGLYPLKDWMTSRRKSKQCPIILLNLLLLSSMRSKKNYNPSVITRSTSCVNAKLEAISQKIMFKGREPKNQNKNRSQTSSTGEYEAREQKAGKEDMSYKETEMEENQLHHMTNLGKLEDKEQSNIVEYSPFVPESPIGRCSEMVNSPSRLLRRRHTTYIKEQGRSKSSLNITEKKYMENMNPCNGEFFDP